jgi:hypothetical protein
VIDPAPADPYLSARVLASIIRTVNYGENIAKLQLQSSLHT